MRISSGLPGTVKHRLHTYIRIVWDPSTWTGGVYLTPREFLNLTDHYATCLESEVARVLEEQDPEGFTQIALPLGDGELDVNNQGYGKYVVHEFDPDAERTRYQIRTGRMEYGDVELEVGWETDCCNLSEIGWEVLKKRMAVLRSELVQKVNRKPNWPPSSMPTQTIKLVERKLIDILRPVALGAPIRYPQEGETKGWRVGVFEHIQAMYRPKVLATELANSLRGTEVGTKALHDLAVLFCMGPNSHCSERIMAELEDHVQKKVAVRKKVAAK